MTWGDPTKPVPVPDGEEVLTFAGLPADDTELVELATQRVESVATLAWLYTRGVGFEADGPFCTPALAEVIKSAAARAVTNPTEARRIEVGGFSTLPGETGWSLRELQTLNSYRKRVG